MRRVALVFGASIALLLVGGHARAGEDHAGQKLQRHDFRGQKLEGARFDEADLTSADFTGAKLKGASFVGANLTQTNLDGADCSGADFSDVKFSSTMARATNFSGAKLEVADLGSYSNFSGSLFVGANLRKARGITEITGCDFSGADLRGASLKEGQDWKSPSTKWTKALYDDATRFPKGIDPDAVGAVKVAAEGPGASEPTAPKPKAGGLPDGLGVPVGGPTAGGKPEPAKPVKAVGTGKDASGQDWRGRDLKSERFDDVNLSKAILMNAQLQEASLRYADLRGADLWGARLDGADMTGCDLREANLKDAHLWGTNLAGANLEGQNLSILWGLSDTSFRGANLRNLKGGLHVTVSKCDFRKADLRGAHLAGPGSGYVATCDFRGALYDDQTRWPKGFDVDGAGAVRVGEAATPGEDDAPPDRLLAPDRDPDAPSEAVVKRVFSDSIRDLAGALIKQYGDSKGVAPAVSVAVRYSVAFKKLTYLAAESTTEGKRYPIDIEGDLTAEGKDGSERTDPIRWTVKFRRTDSGVWKCEQPEAKNPSKDK